MPLERGQLEEAAAFLFHLRVQRQTVAALPHEIAPRTIEDAYAIQDALHDTAGWPIGVLKVGCTSEVAQQVLGIPHPIGGRVPADAVFATGTDLPADFFGSAPAIECEFAARVDATGAVTALAPALELVDPRIDLSSRSAGLGLVADNSGACAVVLGEAVDIADVEDLAAVSVELRTAGGEVLANGSASEVIGGPQASVDWTHAHEEVRGRTVDEGTWIITGTCTGLTPSAFGNHYVADYGPLGTVEFRLGEG